MKSAFLCGVMLVWLTNGATWPLANGSFEEADRGEWTQPWVWLGWQAAVPEWRLAPYSRNVLYFGGTTFHGVFIMYDNKAREQDPTGLFSTLPMVGEVGLGVIPNANTTGGVLAPPPYLEQPSLVPVGTRSLWFLWQGERLDLRVNGDLVPFSLAEQRLTDDPFVPIHDYYAADIRQFAGQEATIRFEFYAHEVHVEVPWPGAVQALDDIYFSAIPEPSPAALLVVGGALLLAGRRRRAESGKWRYGNGRNSPVCVQEPVWKPGIAPAEGSRPTANDRQPCGDCGPPAGGEPRQHLAGGVCETEVSKVRTDPVSY